VKQIAVVLMLIFAGLLAWLFASRLSADALGMAVGLVFGMAAGIPAALLVMAASRSRPRNDDEDPNAWQHNPRIPTKADRWNYDDTRYHPPVIVVVANNNQPLPPVRVLSVIRPERSARPKQLAQGGDR
jgi:hypothetical protein